MNINPLRIHTEEWAFEMLFEHAVLSRSDAGDSAKPRPQPVVYVSLRNPRYATLGIEVSQSVEVYLESLDDVDVFSLPPGAELDEFFRQIAAIAADHVKSSILGGWEVECVDTNRPSLGGDAIVGFKNSYKWQDLELTNRFKG